jgi:hypothetical protein
MRCLISLPSLSLLAGGDDLRSTLRHEPSLPDVTTAVARAFEVWSIALAYNLANSLRQLVLPRSIRI